MLILSTVLNKSVAIRTATAGVLVLLMTVLAESPASAVVNRCANRPTASTVPGQATIDDFCKDNLLYLSNGLAYFAIIAAICGIFISAALWALGSKGQNPGQELTGKKGLIVCCAAAFCIGALPDFMNVVKDAAEQVQANPSATPDMSGTSGNPGSGGPVGNGGGFGTGPSGVFDNSGEPGSGGPTGNGGGAGTGPTGDFADAPAPATIDGAVPWTPGQ